MQRATIAGQRLSAAALRLPSTAPSATAAPAQLLRAAYSTGRRGTVYDTLYHVFMKRNSMYFTSIVLSAIVIEAIYGKMTDGIWNMVNHGRTFETVDWSKFSSPLDEDEDDEEEEEE